MIPVVASEELADYIDVFCDHGFLHTEDTRNTDGRIEIRAYPKDPCQPVWLFGWDTDRHKI